MTNSATKITETTKRKESETSTDTIASSPVTTAQTTTQPKEPKTPSTSHMVTEDTSQASTSNGVQTTLSGSTQRVSTYHQALDLIEQHYHQVLNMKDQRLLRHPPQPMSLYTTHL
ncbi:MAG: hypothetical protein PG981_001247 [Wolbachia endosymbiont of Ctenocephalides orientis wCori]|nr:MAG: hypothetical protein PG981_001247 [Wolbachia endosymbiont of Ctenocephalides orientis wCori]